MKRFEKSALAMALLAGSALVTVPAMAKDLSNCGAGENCQSGMSAKSEAPGQLQKSTDMSAKEVAPGQKQLSGQIDSAKDAAPGQLKSEDSVAVDADKTDRLNANAATEAAPGQKLKNGEVDQAADAAPGQQQKAGDMTAKEAAPGQQQAADQKPSDETTASIEITSEQKTEIRDAIGSASVQPADVDIDVVVGVAVPQSIELHPLPARVVSIMPRYEGYDYFILADGRIVIVDPADYTVVYVIAS